MSASETLDTLPSTSAGGTFHTLAGPPYSLGARATLKCDAGYTRPQVYTASLVWENGHLQWRPAHLPCLAVRCPDPPYVRHGRADQPDFTFPHAFRYVCEEGYVMRGPNPTHYCMPSGRWDPTPSHLVRCEPVVCPELRAPAHGSVRVPIRTFESVARYACDPNYVVVRGDVERTCQKDGTWSGEEVTCDFPTCPPMDPAVKVFMSAGNLNWVDCGQGQSVPVKCLPNGQWSLPHPYCPGGSPPPPAAPLPVAVPPPPAAPLPVAVPPPKAAAPPPALNKDFTLFFKLLSIKILIVFCIIVMVISFSLINRH